MLYAHKYSIIRVCTAEVLTTPDTYMVVHGNNAFHDTIAVRLLLLIINYIHALQDDNQS